MELFGISFENMLLILLVALIIFGPERLPEMASKIGKWINDFRRMSTEFQKLKSDVTETIQETRKEILDLKTEVSDIATDTKKEIEGIKSEVKEALPYEQSYFSVEDTNAKNEDEEKARAINAAVEEAPVTAGMSSNGALGNPFSAAV
jgi:Tat protein translocase TatB subunit